VNPQKFNEELQSKARQLYRDMPWRVCENDGSFDAYKIVVSELMLQQTQVARVIPKYQHFIRKFPTIGSLANADLAEVLQMWSGLGYNRRAKYLHEAAIKLQYIPQPWSYNDLISCVGIGPNTANAVRVYAYNVPEVFIETNIRSVFIHYFFAQSTQVSDKQILELVANTMDKQSPRTWYWSLMDSGANLKNKNLSLSKSSAYKKQPVFEGSLRQIRGRVLKSLISGPCSAHTLALSVQDVRLQSVLNALESEGLVSKRGKIYCLGS